MKQLLTLALVLSALLAAASPVALATTHTVEPGDDIQAAVNAASPGDTILFGPGTFDLPGTLVVDRALTLTSADPFAATKPRVDGGGTLATIIRINADDVVIDGLEIANGTGDLVYQADAHSGTVVRNCTVHDSSGDEGVQLKACTNCRVECNLVYDVAEDGISLADGAQNSSIRNNEIHHVGSENAAIYVYDSYNMTIECNYIHDTEAANGIKLYKNYGGPHTIAHNLIVQNTWQGGKRCYEEADGSTINIYKPRVSSTYVVRHNTLADNSGVDACSNPTGHGIYANDHDGSGFSTSVDDNIVATHNGYGIRTFFGASVTFSYNDLWSNGMGPTDGAPADGGGNIFTDPLFDTDYSLQAGSPCLGGASDGQDMGRVFAECGCGPPLLEVSIDIKPGSDPNAINPKSKGKIPVAILSTEAWDATTGLDRDSLTFGRTGDEDSLAFCNPGGEDVDGNGYPDLVCHFSTQASGFACGDTEGFLKGETVAGVPIVGSDSVKVMPCKK